ncbi:MAG: chemotaxis protein CheW [Gammaproteobacteria bacterium]|nr:chemotaxis protein CheW [Gammaproteobacteria bacterium]
MNKAQAWLLQIDRKTRVAVGHLELIHIVNYPEYYDVPRSPEHCKRVILWNKNIIPVIDMSMLIDGISTYYHKNKIAIAMYENSQTGQYEYGGIQLMDTPILKVIDNNQGVSRSQLSDKWRDYSLSAFKVNEEMIPIVSIRKIFSSKSVYKDKFV